MYDSFAFVYDALMKDVDYAGWAEYILKLARRFGVAKPDKLLAIADVACGTGSIALELAKLGHVVTGIDISQSMLGVAAEKARAAGLRLPLVCQDMREFKLHSSVDIVSCACDGVNYLLSEKDVSAFFCAANSALRPGGLLLFDISSEYKLQKIIGDNTFGDDLSDVSYLWRNSYDPLSKLLEMNLTIFTKTHTGFERTRETHLQRAYGHEELYQLLIAEGFGVVEVYCHNTMRAPRAKDERIMFAAKKLPVVDFGCVATA